MNDGDDEFEKQHKKKHIPITYCFLQKLYRYIKYSDKCDKYKGMNTCYQNHLYFIYLFIFQKKKKENHSYYLYTEYIHEILYMGT